MYKNISTENFSTESKSILFIFIERRRTTTSNILSLTIKKSVQTWKIFKNDCQFKKKKKICKFNNQSSVRLTVRTSSNQFETIRNDSYRYIATSVSNFSSPKREIFIFSLLTGQTTSFFFCFLQTTKQGKKQVNTCVFATTRVLLD